MNRRSVKIMRRKAGGTAGKNAEKYSVNLPAVWLRAMGIQKDNRVELSFDGEKITVRPLASTDSELFRRNAEQKGHQLKEYRYYDGDTLCTVILADFTAEQICIENKVDEILDTAFGVNETPSWEDFLAFLADRCIPKTRKGLDYYLDAVGVPEYDPVLLVEKTQGRMAEDHNGWKLFDAAYYPKQFHFLLKERIETVLMEQQKKLFEK